MAPRETPDVIRDLDRASQSADAAHRTLTHLREPDAIQAALEVSGVCNAQENAGHNALEVASWEA